MRTHAARGCTWKRSTPPPLECHPPRGSQPSGRSSRSHHFRFFPYIPQATLASRQTWRRRRAHTPRRQGKTAASPPTPLPPPVSPTNCVYTTPTTRHAACTSREAPAPAQARTLALIAYSASSSLRNSTNPNPWWTPVTLSFGMCTFATGPAWIMSCATPCVRQVLG